jgi:hypothetical protein
LGGTFFDKLVIERLGNKSVSVKRSELSQCIGKGIDIRVSDEKSLEIHVFVSVSI